MKYFVLLYAQPQYIGYPFLGTLVVVATIAYLVIESKNVRIGQ